ncbi:MAG: hypothetical protein QXF17_04330 [Ignisphaera sp.]
MEDRDGSGGNGDGYEREDDDGRKDKQLKRRGGGGGRKRKRRLRIEDPSSTNNKYYNNNNILDYATGIKNLQAIAANNLKIAENELKLLLAKQLALTTYHLTREIKKVAKSYNNMVIKAEDEGDEDEEEDEDTTATYR